MGLHCSLQCTKRSVVLTEPNVAKNQCDGRYFLSRRALLQSTKNRSCLGAAAGLPVDVCQLPLSDGQLGVEADRVLHLSHCVGVVAVEQISHREPRVMKSHGGIHFDSLPKFDDRLRIPSVENQRVADGTWHDRRERVELLSSAHFSDARVNVSHVIKKFAEPLMRSRVTRILRERGTISLLGGQPVPSVDRGQPERGVRLGQRTVYIER